MIRLSRITDYGIVLMVHLARSPGDPSRNARHLAGETDLPAPVVSKILKALARGGLLTSQRGVKGGYALSRSADDITVPEMITALEGPISLTACTVHPGNCAQESSCDVREPWQQINTAVHDALSRISLADLAAPREPGAVIPLHSLGVNLESTGSE
ncbi:MAG: SUF system Fe-S cluster assembly regulator [Myxococcota bacterium]